MNGTCTFAGTSYPEFDKEDHECWLFVQGGYIGVIMNLVIIGIIFIAAVPQYCWWAKDIQTKQTIKEWCVDFNEQVCGCVDEAGIRWAEIGFWLATIFGFIGVVFLFAGGHGYVMASFVIVITVLGWILKLGFDRS